MIDLHFVGGCFLPTAGDTSSSSESEVELLDETVLCFVGCTIGTDFLILPLVTDGFTAENVFLCLSMKGHKCR